MILEGKLFFGKSTRIFVGEVYVPWKLNNSKFDITSARLSSALPLPKRTRRAASWIQPQRGSILAFKITGVAVQVAISRKKITC